MRKQKNASKKSYKLSAKSSVGLSILIFLGISYFVKINADSGANYVVEDSLLGIVIFHNPFILGLYLLIAVSLIVNGLNEKAVR